MKWENDREANKISTLVDFIAPQYWSGLCKYMCI